MSVREILETGSKKGYRLARKVLKEKYGEIPLCNVKRITKTKNSRTYIWYYCSWLKQWYPSNIFKKKCIKCQEEMVGIVMYQEL